jgi:hypothetical protein
MSTSPLAKKLGIRPQMRMLITAAPDLYHKSLAPLPDGARIASANDGPFTFVQLFATSAADLSLHMPKFLNEAGEDTLVWITYPKIGSRLAGDLSRDKIRAILSDLGWRAVAIVAIDEVWSALRFRPIAKSRKASGGRNRLSDHMARNGPHGQIGEYGRRTLVGKHRTVKDLQRQNVKDVLVLDS